MGVSASGSGSGSKSESSSYSKSSSYLSSLALTQEDILKNREAIFQSYFLPEFQDLYSSMDANSEVGKAQLGMTAKEINASFDAAQKQTNQSLAQRNIADTGAGMALTAANQRARSSALANAYANQMTSSTQNKTTALATLGQLMPQTTTAAPTVSSAYSKGTSSSSSASASGALKL